MNTKPSIILMIRPVRFGFNEQTAESNAFQQEPDLMKEEMQAQALKEFDAFSNNLISQGIHVIIFEDNVMPHTPDSIFPNNWISFHDGGQMVLYPMLAENRRLERRDDIVNSFKEKYSSLIDLRMFEDKGIFLEGTGSIVFDYDHKIAYANISARTDKQLFEQLCKQLDYKHVSFKATDSRGTDIYHTNVLMCIGSGFALVCEDAIPDKNELTKVLQSLQETAHEIITISMEQMNSFAGNMYQLFNEKGERFIVMSEQAYLSLKADQIKQLEQYGKLLHSPLYTIEKYGGGSARCMLADVK